MWTSMACRELIYFIMVFIMGYRAVSVLMPEASSPSSSLTLVSVEFPLTCSHSSVLGALLPQCLVFFFFAVFIPSIFLNMLSQRCCHHPWWAWPWPAAGLSGNWLALALLDLGESSHRSHSHSLSINKILPCKSSTFAQKLLKLLGGS